MKFIFKICLLVFIINNHSYSQWQPNVCSVQGSFTSILQLGDTILTGSRTSGIYKSTNNGNSWSLTTTGLTIVNVNGFKNVNKIIYAATESGLYISTNTGSSWAILNSGLPLGIKSIDANNVYIFAGTSVGVFRSSNNGVNWTLLNNGITNDTYWSLISKDNYVFVSTSTGAKGTVFVSTNNGDSWNSANQGLPFFFVNTFAVMNNTIFAGGIGVYKTTNFGNSWVNAGIPDYIDISSISVSGNNVVTCGPNVTGVRLSTNGSNSWTTVTNNLPNPSIMSVSIEANKIFAGSYTRGIYRSDNSGSNWNSINYGISNFNGNDILVRGEKIFIGTSRGLCKSTNNGLDWSSVIIENLNNQIITDLSNTINDIYVVESNLIFKSTNDGENWLNVSNYMKQTTERVAAKDNYLLSSGIYSETFRSSNNGASWLTINVGFPLLDIANVLTYKDNDVYIGFKKVSSTGGIYKSTNNGINWIDISNGLSSRDIFSIVAAGNKLFVGVKGNIYKSTDNGITWNSISNQLPSNYGYTSLLLSNNTLIAGSNGAGIFVSSDSGNNWSNENSGLDNLNISSLGIKDNIVFAGTSGSGCGLWQRSFSSLVNIHNETNAVSDNFNLFQNFPNPFNPKTNINFQIPYTSYVSLKVFDINGKLVSILVDKSLNAGKYNLDFDGNNLSSGIYIYKLEFEKFNVTKRMILLK